MTIADEPIIIRKKITIEADATVGGLMGLLMRLPQEVPHEAEICDVSNYFTCDHMDTPEGVEVPEHESREMLAIVIEWDAEEAA